jgi:hypothetical protein
MDLQHLRDVERILMRCYDELKKTSPGVARDLIEEEIHTLTYARDLILEREVMKASTEQSPSN